MAVQAGNCYVAPVKEHYASKVYTPTEVFVFDPARTGSTNHKKLATPMTPHSHSLPVSMNRLLAYHPTDFWYAP